MKTVLITGVAGLIGASLAHYITKNFDDEYVVVGLDNLSGGYIDNLPKKDNFYFYNIDVAKDSLDAVFEEYEPDYVFHLSAYAAEGLSPFIRKFNYSNNVTATANIVNACINYDVKRLVYTSSMSVYGDGIKGKRFDETLTPQPLDPYAISKYACELDIQSAGLTHNLDWCIIRPHNVYGPLQNIWDPYRNVLGIWMCQKLYNEPITIYGSGEQTRAFSYIDDFIPSLWNAAFFTEASKQIINVGGMSPHSINEACEIELRVIGDHKVVHKEQRFEVKHAIPTFEKSVKILDYKEHYSLEEGLSKMWEWAKTQPKRPRTKWESYEVEKGLYSYWK